MAVSGIVFCCLVVALGVHGGLIAQFDPDSGDYQYPQHREFPEHRDYPGPDYDYSNMEFPDYMMDKMDKFEIRAYMGMCPQMDLTVCFFTEFLLECPLEEREPSYFPSSRDGGLCRGCLQCKEGGTGDKGGTGGPNGGGGPGGRDVAGGETGSGLGETSTEFVTGSGTGDHSEDVDGASRPTSTESSVASEERSGASEGQDLSREDQSFQSESEERDSEVEASEQDKELMEGHDSSVTANTEEVTSETEDSLNVETTAPIETRTERETQAPQQAPENPNTPRRDTPPPLNPMLLPGSRSRSGGKPNLGFDLQFPSLPGSEAHYVGDSASGLLAAPLGVNGDDAGINGGNRDREPEKDRDTGLLCPSLDCMEVERALPCRREDMVETTMTISMSTGDIRCPACRQCRT